MKNKYNVILIEVFAIIITLLVLIMIKVPDAKKLAGAVVKPPAWATEERWAVREAAFTYLNKGVSFQYDSSLYRGDYYSPFDATMEDRKYIDDAGFIISLYNHIIVNGSGTGYIMKDSKSNYIKTSKDMFNLGMNDSYSNIVVRNMPAVSSEKKVLQSELEAGDIIVYEYDKYKYRSLLYIGYDDVVYATGKNYDYSAKKDNVESNGALKLISLNNDVLNNKNKKETYIFGSNVSNIAVLRPLNDIVKKPTKNSEYRLANKAITDLYNSKIVASQRASVGKYHSVNLGDTIKYTITVRNADKETYNTVFPKITNSNKDINVTIPDTTTLVNVSSDRYTVKGESNKIIHWKNKIPAYQKSLTTTYTVKVGNGNNVLLNYGKYIVNNKADIRGVPLNTINTRVARPLPTFAKDDLLKEIKSRIGQTFRNTSNLLNEIYSDITFPTVDKLTNMFFDKSNMHLCTNCAGCSECYNYTYFIIKYDITKLDKTFTDMLIVGLMGGNHTYITSGDLSGNSLINGVFSRGQQFRKSYEVFNKDTFMVGDVLVVYDDDGAKDTYLKGVHNMYIYMGNNTFATVDSTGKAVMINETNGKRLIESLLGQNLFYVLRPSHTSHEIAGMGYYESFGILVDKNYAIYDKNSNNSLNFGDTKLSIKLDNNTTKEVSLNDKDVKVTKVEETASGTDKITIEYKGNRTTIETKIKDKPADISSQYKDDNKPSGSGNSGSSNSPSAPNIPGSFTSEDNIETPIDTTTNSDNNEINENNNDNTLLYIGIAIVVLTLGYLLILNKDMFKKK